MHKKSLRYLVYCVEAIIGNETVFGFDAIYPQLANDVPLLVESTDKAFYRAKEKR